MTPASQRPKRSVRFFRGAGYFFTLGAWLWVLLFYTPFLLQLPWPVPGKSTQRPAQFELVLPEPLIYVVAIIVVVGVVGVVGYSLWKMPGAIIKNSEQLSRRSAELLVPIVAKAPLPPAQKRRLSLRLSYVVRCAAAVLAIVVTVPLAFLSFPPPYDVGIPFLVIIGLVAIHTLPALLCYLVAFSLEVSRKKKSGKQGRNTLY